MGVRVKLALLQRGRRWADGSRAVIIRASMVSTSSTRRS